MDIRGRIYSALHSSVLSVVFDHKVNHKVNRKTACGWRHVFGSHGCLDGLLVVGKKFVHVGLFRRLSLMQPCMRIVSLLTEVAIQNIVSRKAFEA